MKQPFYSAIIALFITLIFVTVSCENDSMPQIDANTETSPETVWEYSGTSKTIPKVIGELKSSLDDKERLERRLLENDVLWEEAQFLVIDNKKRILVPFLSTDKENVIGILSLTKSSEGKTDWTMTVRGNLVKNTSVLPFWNKSTWYSYFMALDSDILEKSNGNPGLLVEKSENYIKKQSDDASKLVIVCNNVYIGQVCITTTLCHNYGSEGGCTSYGSTTDCYPEYEEQCYWYDDGTGNGGDDGGGGDDDDDSGSGGNSGNDEDQIIVNFEGKTKCVYDKLIGTALAGHNLITDTFLFFGGGNPFGNDLTYQTSPNLTNDEGEELSGMFEKVGDNYIITLNESLIESHAPIEIARTILHESVHALLRNEYVNVNDSFVSLFGEYMISKTGSNSITHNIMRVYYIDAIANVLKQFDNNQEIDSYYENLAWVGLHQYMPDIGISEMLNSVQKARDKGLNCN